MADIPFPETPPGVPSPASDQTQGGEVELQRKAKRTLDFHTKGLDSLRLRILTAEKYMLHVDGEGLSQWYDIIDGQRLSMMPSLNGFSPTQDNQMSPILDNFIAHLTSQPYRFVVDAKRDKKSRQSAIIDQALINAQAKVQKWNSLMAQAKAFAAVFGSCPIHSMVREHNNDYEAVATRGAPISIDSFVGNPFDHVKNGGAVRGSTHRRTWGRSLPADMVRQIFGRPDLRGSKRLPSAASFQRAVRKWTRLGHRKHGNAEMVASDGHEELIALIYDEVLAGVDPMYPENSLCIIAIQDSATTNPEDARSAQGRAVHLWSGPLPGGLFSAIDTYSHHRFDDPYGKPYLADVDEDQIEINQLQTIFKEYQRRASRPELGGSGGVEVDTVGPQGDTYFQLEQIVGGAQTELQWLQFPNAHIPPLQAQLQMRYDSMYRKAGWQAASRGETQGSGKAIIALQVADDSIMGPISGRTAEDLEDMAVQNWRLLKTFMTADQVIEAAGSELAHLASSYVNNTMMSDTPPRFQLVSKFGTNTEAIAQQLLNMIGVTDTAGEPILTARQFKKQWPDQSTYHEIEDPRDFRESRPLKVNQMIRDAADQKTAELMQQFMDPMTGQSKWQPSMGDPFTQQLGLVVEMEVAQQEDVLMDDDMAKNIETLSIITQDPTEHPVARRAAIQRQMRYMMWLAGQQQQQQQQSQAVQQEAAGQAARQGVKDQAAGKRPTAQEAFNPAAEGGTTSAQGMVEADRQFSRKTA